MIDFDHLTYSYPTQDGDRVRPATQGRPDDAHPTSRANAQAPVPVLCDISLRIEEGEFVLLIGPSGAGKSTLLRCINGLVPHFYGGEIGGRIRVAGRDPVALEPRRMSDVVGFVFQDPETQAVTDMVEDELAFAMENQGLPPSAMRKRIEEVLDQLNIAPLRQRKITTLSGGERQRVAIAAVLTLQPQVLVLDEPTSQLDPQAAEEVLDTLVKLNHDLGLTIVLSEHRLERVVQYVDRVIYMPGRGAPLVIGDPGEVLAQVPLVPPLVELGKRLGWSPLPLTLKDARRMVRRPEMRRLLQAGNGQRIQNIRRTNGVHGTATTPRSPGADRVRPVGTELSSAQEGEPPALEIRNLRFTYGRSGSANGAPVHGAPVLRGIDLTVQQGEFVAIMGRNGAGKSTLLKQCIGLLKPQEGRVRVLGLDTQQIQIQELARHIGYVPQNPNALLFADTIAQELAFTRRAQGADQVRRADQARPAEPKYLDDESLLRTLGLAGMEQLYPRDLSAGERQRVALAAVLVGNPELILLDEPTRGLDYEQKASLIAFLQTLRSARTPANGDVRADADTDGHEPAGRKTVIVVTHDVELVAQCAERVILMGNGEIVVDGPVREVMSNSQVFASQINKLFRDPRYLTVEDVTRTIERHG